jgi:hypothetical protein
MDDVVSWKFSAEARARMSEAQLARYAPYRATLSPDELDRLMRRAESNHKWRASLSPEKRLIQRQRKRDRQRRRAAAKRSASGGSHLG